MTRILPFLSRPDDDRSAALNANYDLMLTIPSHRSHSPQHASVSALPRGKPQERLVYLDDKVTDHDRSRLLDICRLPYSIFRD